MTTNISKTNNNTDRITLRKSVSVMNQKQKTGSGRSLERYFNDDPRIIAEIEELELEYLFK
jgi:hypothetical protein